MAVTKTPLYAGLRCDGPNGLHLGFARGVRLHGHRLCSSGQHGLHDAGPVTIGQRLKCP
ncbi:hypothetical protein ACP70R_008653 [Stipagrostis hirtigluma subsp. patula]